MAALLDLYPSTQLREADERLTATYMQPAMRSGPALFQVNGGDNNLALLPRDLANENILGVTGTPVVHPGYVRTHGQLNFLRSTVLEPPRTYTLFAFLRRSDTINAPIMGTYADNLNPGCLLWWNSTTTLRYQVTQGANTVKQTTITKASNSNKFNRYRIEVIRDIVTGHGTVIGYDDSLGGVPGTTGTLDAAAKPNLLPFRFGSSYNASILGHAEWGFLAGYEGIGTPQEIANQWDRIIALGAANGINEGD